MVPFLLSLMLMFFQQLSGINALLTNASQQLVKAAVSNASIVASFTVGGTQVMFTVVGILLVERLGRKVLLVAGSVGMAVSCFLLAINLYLVQSATSNSTAKYTPLAMISIVVYNAAFSVGWGPLPWVMMSELVPTSVRGISSSIATAVNWSLNTFVTFTFTYYEDTVHPYGAWFTFAGIILISIPTVIVLLPETKGRTMQEIESIFESPTYGKCPCNKRRAENDILLPVSVQDD